MSDGTYDVNFGYVLAENPTVYAAVYNGANFQDTTTDKSKSCSALTVFNGTNTSAIVTLTDARNGQQYRVAKLADNQCWMLDNLKLELTNSTVLTPQDSDVTTDTPVTLAAGGLTGNFTTSGYNTVDNTSSSGTNYVNYDAWRQNDPSTGDTSNYCGGDESARTSTNWPSGTLTGCGYLYNFYTATASSGNSSTTSSLSSYSFFNAPYSICPKNWHLPKMYDDNGNYDEFAILNASMNAGHLTSADMSDYHAKWQPAGAWQSVFSGAAFGGYPFLSDSSEWGYYQASTADKNGSDNIGIADWTARLDGIVFDAGESIRCALS